MTVFINSNSFLELRTRDKKMAELFNGMTNAILDAMNRGTDRYDGTAQEVNQLKNRVSRLKNLATDAA